MGLYSTSPTEHVRTAIDYLIVARNQGISVNYIMTQINLAFGKLDAIDDIAQGPIPKPPSTTPAPSSGSGGGIEDLLALLGGVDLSGLAGGEIPSSAGKGGFSFLDDLVGQQGVGDLVGAAVPLIIGLL